MSGSTDQSQWIQDRVKRLDQAQRMAYFSQVQTELKDDDTYAALLWVFGSLGAHRFYLGQVGHGIFHLLMGLSGIVAVIAGAVTSSLWVMGLGVLLMVADWVIWLIDLVGQKKMLRQYNQAVQVRILNEISPNGGQPVEPNGKAA